MAYEVNFPDPSKTPIIVEDGTLNTDTSLVLVGKNFSGYGEYIAEDLLALLDNFANSTPPQNPTIGQQWFNTDDGIMYIFGGASPDDWRTLNYSMITQLVVRDITNVDHIVTALMDEGNLIGVISSEEFTIDNNPQDPLYDDFDEITNGEGIIKAGITLKEGLMFHGTATSAQYADLAEMYKSDKMYIPGTVVKIGGVEEVTHTASPYSDDVFGIVSTNPAYLMNSKCPGVAVALEGRVPCQVIGKVSKGDRLVSSDVPGVAMVGDPDKVTWKNQVGRALEHKETEELGLVEVVVGAK